SVVFDNAKLKRYAPDMTTHIPFSEGARIALKYILEHPEECQKPDPEFDKFCDDVINALEEAKKKL
ncbi:MAG: NAD-dependent dehydratase, partial [Lachnospiraceae bacterium]|nr:NAD-dependent dehydratase [Lachnospiraceae bacterium]